MKKILLLTLIIVATISGCRKIEVDGDSTGTGTGGNQDNLVLSGKINADRTLKTGSTYKLRGVVYVVDGATLTVEPGAIIQGEKSSRGALIITRGSKLIADGTKEKPIVFTSDASTPTSGDWGGIVLLGRARTNASYNNTAGIGEIEGGINNSDGHGLYGGADDDDNSGILRYVRIEYAGYAFLPDKELNSLTMGGVGRGTTIDYVEVSYALDDAFEWFGGAVNCKHLIAFKTLDDDFDTDNGFRGNVQWGIIIRDSTRADVSSVESFESDNDATGSALLPQTAAVFSNITSIGPKANINNTVNSRFLAGAQIRRNSSISIFNSVIMGWPRGVYIDARAGVPTDNNIRSNSLLIQNTIIAGCNTPLDYTVSTAAPTGWTAASVESWFTTAGFGNAILNTVDEVKLTAPFNYATPDLTPQAGSPLLTGGGFTNAKLAAGFTATTYRGAVGAAGTADADWWKGWTKFN
ncbi:MAG: hypothetical protein WKF97_09705 [Chitinophagaceae bacterium]